MRKNSLKNHDLFSVIDTEEKAYWLGFLIQRRYRMVK